MSGAGLPTFLVIGAMKAGTTSLWGYLRSHPDVYMSQQKELHYFSSRAQFERGLDWYRGQFATAGDAQAVGEASPSYTKHPSRSGTAGRIAKVIPDVRLVYVVREPLSRIRSHYLHAVHHGERRPLSVVVREDPEYVDTSRYQMQIDQYLQHFDRSQLLVITAEALHRERTATLRRVFEFVGVEPVAVDASPELDRTADKRVETSLSTRARRFDEIDLVRRLTPRPVRRLASRMTRRPVSATGDDTISADLARELRERLRDDVIGLRPFLGATFDGWGIA